MSLLVRKQILCVLAALLSLPVLAVTDFDMEHVKHFKLFRRLYDEGPDSVFYQVAADYERFLKNAGKQVEYFKIKCNEGFYDVDHHHIIRAMKTAESLDKEIREAGMGDELGYLPIGLLGDISRSSRNMRRAKEYYEKALEIVGTKDKKFSVEKYINLAELVYLNAPEEALRYADKAVALAEGIDDIEYKSKALALKGYVYFLSGNRDGFYPAYNGYEALRSMDHPRFSHRYDNMMLAARLAIGHQYAEAEQIAINRELNMDRSLMLLKIYAMSGDIQKGFTAINRRINELDSIAGSVQELNLDDMEAEMQMNKLKIEADNNKRLAKRTIIALMIIIVVFIIVFIIGRRRFMQKIQVRNKELEVARDRAQESDRMKTAFIRNMSHEIRTPLTAINGFSQILCSPAYDLDNEERGKIQKRITENVDNISEIVKELLALSKGESEAVKTDVQPVSICRKVVQDAKRKNTKGLIIRFRTLLPDMFTFQCQAENLEQILSRLMDNALKFTEQGSITMECHQQGALLLFSVTDTGVGVKEEDRERIFENFVKLDEYKGGVGLGLSICRGLARQMGGDVNLDVQYNAGARFILSLPL
jgi:signal transduction histidine kinase